MYFGGQGSPMDQVSVWVEGGVTLKDTPDVVPVRVHTPLGDGTLGRS